MLFRFFLSSLAIGVLVGPSAAADEPGKFVGTWKTKVKFAGYDQTIAISFDRDKWSVTGTFQRDNAVVGTFFGDSPGFAGGRLTYRSKYIKKPDEGWGEDNVTLRLDGEALIMSFPLSSGGDIVRAFARTADEPKTVTNKTPPATPDPAPTPQDKFVGTWKGNIGGYDEIWTVKKSDGTWSINGKLLFNGAEYGSFIGNDAKESNGTLTFTRKFVKTPPRNPNLVDEVSIVVKPQGENLSYTWSGGEKKGAGALERVAAVGEKPADDDKSKAVIGQWYHETNGMDVAWVVGKNADGTWFVRGQYIKPKTRMILGGFEGKDFKFEDGKLSFTRVWLRKPNSTSRDLGHVTIRSIGKDMIHLAIKELDGSTYNKDCPRLPGTQ